MLALIQRPKFIGENGLDDLAEKIKRNKGQRVKRIRKTGYAK
jgi:hypothetical protein